MLAHRSTAPAAGQPAWPNIPGLNLRSKRWIEVEGRFAIGEGGGQLLMAIAETGSLSRGAQKVGWSYRHAWGYLRRAEGVLGTPLVAVRHGKGVSRGARLTDAAFALAQTLLA